MLLKRSIQRSLITMFSVAALLWLTSPAMAAAAADLSVTITGPAGIVRAGDSAAYTITVTNNGPDAAVGVNAISSFDPGFTIVSSTVTPSFGDSWWSFASILAGNTEAVTVNGTVGAGVSGSITNSVIVSSSSTDPNEGNDGASVTTTITPPLVNYEVTFDAIGLTDGAFYIVTINSVPIPVIAIPGPDYSYSVVEGTEVNYIFVDPAASSFGDYPYVSVSPTSPQTVNASLAVVGTYASGTISGYVFNDANNNGVRNAGETGIAGVTVELWGSHAVQQLTVGPGTGLFQTTTTGADGGYAFGGVSTGEFFTRALLPAGGTQDSPPITLVIDGTSVSSGTADFPLGADGQPTQLPYAGR